MCFTWVLVFKVSSNERKESSCSNFSQKGKDNHNNEIIFHGKMKLNAKNELKKSNIKDDLCNSADKFRQRRGVVTANAADAHSSMKKNVTLCNKI